MGVRVTKSIKIGFVPPSASEMAMVGEQAISTIHKRTVGGNSVDGSRFKSYSDGYKKAITSGRKGVVQKDPNLVNLTATGDMLRGMTQSATVNSVVIFFNSAEQMAKAFYNDRTRNFFGLSVPETKRVFEVIKNFIRRNNKL